MLSLAAAALSFAGAPLANRVMTPQAGAALSMNAKADLEGAQPRPADPMTAPDAWPPCARCAEFAKELNPVIGYWDPLGLADLPLWQQDQDAVIGARHRRTGSRQTPAGAATALGSSSREPCPRRLAAPL